MSDEKEKSELTIERLHTQISFLKTIILISFVAGSCVVGLVFAHLWHDKQAFKKLNETVIEIRENVITINDEMQRLHQD